jgi:S-adenosylmethionine-diacylgycerolhomoserine-N-methlytransferase
MAFFSDLKTIYHMLRSGAKGNTHAERLDNFYSGQAKGYDDFRKRLLKGREELWAALANPEIGGGVPEGGVWVDFGGGTGANLERFAEEDRKKLKKIYVVDLAHSLLEVCNQRIADKFTDENGNTNCCTAEADATTWTPDEGYADVVTFSYSLTMIPDWFAAMDNALRILKPGGIIGVVDFYVSRKWPAEGLRRHSWFTRSYWPVHFNTDNVYPSPDHVPYLMSHFETVDFQEYYGKIPYIPIIRMPYYTFVGKKKETVSAS